MSASKDTFEHSGMDLVMLVLDSVPALPFVEIHAGRIIDEILMRIKDAICY